MSRTRISTIVSCLVWLWCGLCFEISALGEEVLLERDVLPVLTKHCLGCHGGLRQRAGLDLRTLPSMLAGGNSGAVIQAGHADGSALWQRVANDEMPAGDREKLSAKEKATFKAWIDAGLPTVSQLQRNVDPLLPAGQQHAPAEVAAAIDQHVDGFLAAAQLSPAARSDDVEFLRRVYLDLSGRVPTAQQALSFLASEDSQKRTRLIDSLLAAPTFGDQFGRTWRDWICPPELPSTGNAGEQPHRQAQQFGQWIGNRLTTNRPWDQIVREILTVRGKIANQPQLIFYGLVGKDAKATAAGSARAVASLFMGVQLQCARCHDDPYRDWSQQQHWGLAAFFGHTKGDFTKIEVGTGPAEILIPSSAFKNVGASVSAAFLRGAPLATTDVADLRTPFVDWLVARNNPFFARAFANRVWFYLFARGLVNPIDDLRELNPPSHPGLLTLLTNEFSAAGYDVKHLFRCICNSRVYQRSSWIDPSTDAAARGALTAAFGRMPLRVMNSDMLYDSLRLVYGASILDLRTSVKHVTVGMSAAVADPYLEFRRCFGTNEDDATDFTHGVAQMLTLINHPRLLAGSSALDAVYFPEFLSLPPVHPSRNEDLFAPVKTRFVRFTIEDAEGQPCLDELEVYAPGSDTNLADASLGAQAGASSLLRGYDMHQVQHLNDGKYGNANSWISGEKSRGWAQIKLPADALVNRVVWGRDREEQYQDRVPRRYRIEVSLDGESWTRVSDSARRMSPQADGKTDARKKTLTTARQAAAIEWLYLNTLSRRPTEQETAEALEYVKAEPDTRTALQGVLWMLVNRSEYVFIR